MRGRVDWFCSFLRNDDKRVDLFIWVWNGEIPHQLLKARHSITVFLHLYWSQITDPSCFVLTSRRRHWIIQSSALCVCTELVVTWFMFTSSNSKGWWGKTVTDPEKNKMKQIYCVSNVWNVTMETPSLWLNVLFFLPWRKSLKCKWKTGSKVIHITTGLNNGLTHTHTHTHTHTDLHRQINTHTHAHSLVQQ